MITLEQCIKEACTNKELLEQFDRLAGTSLTKKKAPIEKMIDEHTGLMKDEWFRFFNFIRDYVWLRLPPNNLTK